MSNKLTKVARELLMIEADLPFRLDYNIKPRHDMDDFDLYTFEQTWGSTALGFGGIGGQAITTARTYVFVPTMCDEKCYVYFAGRFAYSVPYSDRFMEDVRSQDVAALAKAGRYAGGVE